MIADGWTTLRVLRSSVAASRDSHEKLRARQEARLRSLLVHAYERVPLYRDLYDRAGFRPQAFRGLEDVEQIPVLSKEHLKSARPEDLIDRRQDPKRCQIRRTSGSTGIPLEVYLGPREISWHRAVSWRILFEHGFRWTDRTLEIRGRRGANFPIQRLGIAPKTWLSILDPPESWARRLAEDRHDVIVASAGTLEDLAKAVASLGLEPPRPRIIYSDSEGLTPQARQTVARALGCEPTDVYGMVEVSDVAWECEVHRGYHVSADSHLVEVVGSENQPGHLLVTALGMWTMPIIRYDTGDVAEWQDGPCPCGRTFPVLRQIHGRRIDSAVLADGRRLYWQYFYELLSEYKELERWRIVQRDLGSLHLEIVAPKRTDDLVTRITADLRRALPAEMALTVEPVSKIEGSPSDRTRLIRSEVPTHSVPPTDSPAA